jgi:pyruvate/2-oxoglutarate dehydrogenase complex dihydrolipoamide dehydrogenase (E3) component
MSGLNRPRTPGERDGDRSQSLILPDDFYNRKLVENVHPSTWTNPTPSGRYNLVVLGAGTAGIVSAVGAAILGAKVAIVEKHLMGGDCLNLGCVPSKALLRAARAVADAREAAAFGISAPERLSADFALAMERMRKVRASISPHDSAEQLVKFGAEVFFGEAKFVSPDIVEVDGRRLRFARAVITTGARAATPPIPGIAEAGYLTNETVFSLTALPKRLIVIGAGPLGCELAQAFRCLGSEVSLVSRGTKLLPREDDDASAMLSARFAREGIRLLLGVKIRRVEKRGGGKAVIIEWEGADRELIGDELLVGVGRAPNVEGLNLEAASVKFDDQGVKVDDQLRTDNRRIYAAGDVCAAYKFTHMADAMARIALQNALFFGRKSASALVVPWCTYTQPEVAHVGLYEKEARERGFNVATFTLPLTEVDRPVIDGDEEGFARVHVARRSGRILGASLVARHAGEMIAEMSLAITTGRTLGTISKTIHPYPTEGEIWKRLADEWNRSRLTPRLQRLFGRYLRLRRLL